MEFAIRPYHPSDLPAVYRICLLTGDSGSDASASFTDPDLLGHYYAAPYCVLEPDIAFILTVDGAPSGYVLGTRDSARFYQRCEEEWFPVLREHYPLPPEADQSYQASMIRAIHYGHRHNPDLQASYPAHLHIDLLPQAVAQGNGRRMMQTFLDRLRAVGVPGVHLGVGGQNTRAIAFYQRMGFQALQTHEWGIIFGMQFSSEVNQ
jgi:ribosomal protein S18 acetylase RimI-like enzyme